MDKKDTENIRHEHEHTHEHGVLPHDHGADGSTILDVMPSDEDIKTVSDTLSYLGDPIRLKIFWILCHYEECVINIAALTGMSSPAVSHHLRILKNSGLITSKRNGKEMYYRVADTPIAASLHHTMEQIAEISCPGEIDK
jgi:DNA-binding transcriptional ArsR family regulator